MTAQLYARMVILPYIQASVGTTPSRSRTRGATSTEKTATIRPQPKNTNPSACADMCSGNGV